MGEEDRGRERTIRYVAYELERFHPKFAYELERFHPNLAYELERFYPNLAYELERLLYFCAVI